MAKSNKWPIDDGAIIAITGPSGVGKTTLLGTLCKEYTGLVLDADGHARMRLREYIQAGRLEVRRISGYDAALEAILELRDTEREWKHHFVALDSATLLAERYVREAALAANVDTPDQAERNVGTQRARMTIMKLADLADPDQFERPRHIIFTCLMAQWRVALPPLPEEKAKGRVSKQPVGLLLDEVGAVKYGPHLPGKLAGDFGAWMTEHYRMVLTDVRTGTRALRTRPDGEFEAKGSSVLAVEEPPDLLAIIKKIYRR